MTAAIIDDLNAAFDLVKTAATDTDRRLIADMLDDLRLRARVSNTIPLHVAQEMEAASATLRYPQYDTTQQRMDARYLIRRAVNEMEDRP